MKSFRLAAAAAVAAFASGLAAAETHPIAATPAPGPARSIGSYANGCIQGATSIALEGPGWRVIRPHRNRNWGHPALIATVREIARRVFAATGRVILIADIAQPRGGPATGHASHQIGLDADIRFLLVPDRPLDPVLRDEGPELSMLAEGAQSVDPNKWSGNQAAMLKLTAELPAVDRIFVNPVIKRHLCNTTTGDRRWLSKIVPWYGHDGHMHVRIHCPEGSSDCRPQGGLPADDGCGAALAWWFTTEPYQRRGSRPGKPPEPPAVCRAVWHR